MAGQEERCSGLGCPYWHEAEHYKQPVDYPVKVQTVLSRNDYNNLEYVANHQLDETSRAIVWGILKNSKVV